ncbi:hypothetical protein [Magnetococcus sp. PR-3]|uniref:hypothetical protein n=1 Tax=Magnetococcus sp. PR-3 TaxID=3120355 RepID=UPI002FCE1D77
MKVCKNEQGSIIQLKTELLRRLKDDQGSYGSKLSLMKAFDHLPRLNDQQQVMTKCTPCRGDGCAQQQKLSKLITGLKQLKTNHTAEALIQQVALYKHGQRV